MRIIDADKLLDDMKKELEKAVNDENLDKDECMVILTSAIALKDFVNRQPTAFDVSKVLKEFETRRKTYEIEADNVDTPSPYVCYYRGMMRGYQYSKEIIEESLSEIKAGGIDDN